jgi:hypothetical protein
MMSIPHELLFQHPAREAAGQDSCKNIEDG